MRSTAADRPGSVVLHGGVTIAGAVGSAGSSGWSCRKLGTGSYAISFDKPLPRVPTVILHTFSSGGAIFPCLQNNVTPLGFGVTTINSNTTAAADQPFGFTVVI
jgi:hypothetical protein